MDALSVFIFFISLGILFQMINTFALMISTGMEVSGVEGLYQVTIGILVGIGTAAFYCIAEKYNESRGSHSVFRDSFYNTIFSWLGGFLGNFIAKLLNPWILLLIRWLLAVEEKKASTLYFFSAQMGPYLTLGNPERETELTIPTYLRVNYAYLLAIGTLGILLSQITCWLVKKPPLPYWLFLLFVLIIIPLIYVFIVKCIIKFPYGDRPNLFILIFSFGYYIPFFNLLDYLRKIF